MIFLKDAYDTERIGNEKTFSSAPKSVPWFGFIGPMGPCQKASNAPSFIERKS
jgi:hypothetical protein